MSFMLYKLTENLLFIFNIFYVLKNNFIEIFFSWFSKDDIHIKKFDWFHKNSIIYIKNKKISMISLELENFNDDFISDIKSFKYEIIITHFLN